MFKRTEERHVRWAREHFPLFAMRSDSEVQRIVSKAREAVGPARLAITVAGSVAGFLLAHWIENKWLAGALSASGEFLFLLTAAMLVGGVSGIASEALLRARIERIAKDSSIR